LFFGYLIVLALKWLERDACACRKNIVNDFKRTFTDDSKIF